MSDAIRDTLQAALGAGYRIERELQFISRGGSGPRYSQGACRV